MDTYVVPHDCTVDQHKYVHFLRKILRPKVRQMHSQMLSCVIIHHNIAHLHIATSVITVF